MVTMVEAMPMSISPDALAQSLQSEPHLVFLRSGLRQSPRDRYSLVAVDPFLTFVSRGSHCEITSSERQWSEYGNPWSRLESLLLRYEVLDGVDLPFPLGGCFGYWGFELKSFLEPRLTRRAVVEEPWPDCWVGFYDSLMVFDHESDRVWIVATGLGLDGSREARRAQTQVEGWRERWARAERAGPAVRRPVCRLASPVDSTLDRPSFLAAVAKAQDYIRAGHIYQVNLSQRLSAAFTGSSWDWFQALSTVAPAPFAAYIDAGEFQLGSSSPELFLRLTQDQVLTRPIKGTRARSSDPVRDAQLTHELQTSAKEMAELVMITDLLRNDLGRICEYGSVKVPELVRLEQYAHVQHLVSSVEGRLRAGFTHLAAMAACFPGGSVTGAPKIRALEIIDELEPVARGPYTGALGYVGFNRESQLSIAIRVGFCRDGRVHFPVGAGIVADSLPEAEYEETWTKARGFLETLAPSWSRPEPIAAERPAGTATPAP